MQWISALSDNISGIPHVKIAKTRRVTARPVPYVIIIPISPKIPNPSLSGIAKNLVPLGPSLNKNIRELRCLLRRLLIASKSVEFTYIQYQRTY